VIKRKKEKRKKKKERGDGNYHGLFLCYSDLIDSERWVSDWCPS
jgi:hypothetical protein